MRASLSKQGALAHYHHTVLEVRSRNVAMQGGKEIVGYWYVKDIKAVLNEKSMAMTSTCPSTSQQGHPICGARLGNIVCRRM